MTQSRGFVPYVTVLLANNLRNDFKEIEKIVESDQFSKSMNLYVVGIEDGSVKEFTKGRVGNSFEIEKGRSTISFIKSLNPSAVVDAAGSFKSLITALFSRPGISIGPEKSAFKFLYGMQWKKDPFEGAIFDVPGYGFDADRKEENPYLVKTGAEEPREYAHIPVSGDRYLLWIPDNEEGPLQWEKLKSLTFHAERENLTVRIVLTDEDDRRKFVEGFYIMGRNHILESVSTIVENEADFENAKGKAWAVVFSSRRSKFYKPEYLLLENLINTKG